VSEREREERQKVGDIPTIYGNARFISRWFGRGKGRLKADD
jgi:hypothetical protein